MSLSLLSGSAQAVTPSGWSWTNGDPVIFSKNKVNEAPGTTCDGAFRLREVDGVSGFHRICVTEGDEVSFGIYPSTFGSYYAPVISFGNEDKMHQLFGICFEYKGCYYVPETDTMIVRERMFGGTARSLKIYKDFSKKLVRSQNLVTRVTEYNFLTDKEPTVFMNYNNTPFAVGGVGVSKNGRYMAVELRGRGFAILDLLTLQIREISRNTDLHYGYGMDPTGELAITNDGRYIAVTGRNAGFRIYEVNSGCGSPSFDISYVYFEENAFENCPISSVYRGSFDSIYYGTAPSFNDDGGELGFYMVTNSYEVYEILLRAVGYNLRTMDYIALGDSYNSGQGETNDVYYLPHTNDKYEKCHTSSRSYPFLLSNWMGIDSSRMASVACSNALTSDIVGSDEKYLGQEARFGLKGANLQGGEVALMRTEALQSFIPGRRHQIGFISYYRPKIVTIGVGGNDADFVGKLKTCITKDICDWAGTDEGRNKTAKEIKNLFPTLVKTYQAIHDASPKSKVYVIGYPRIVNPTGRCNLINGWILKTEERTFINEGIAYLNQVAEAAARRVGVKFIDIEDAYADHALCDKGKPSAMNAIRFGDDSSVFGEDGLKQIGDEGFHPTPYGHEMAFGKMAFSVGNLMEYEYCPDGQVVCPDPTSVAPMPSAYWLFDEALDLPDPQAATYVYDENIPDNPKSRSVAINNFTFDPNTEVRIEINSLPRLIGNYMINEKGGLSVDIELPFDLDFGYHTIHTYGQGYSGKQIDLYQIIYFGREKKSVVKQNSSTISQQAMSPLSTSVTNLAQVAQSTSLVSETISNKKGVVKGISTTVGLRTNSANTDDLNYTSTLTLCAGLGIFAIALAIHRFLKGF